MIFFLHIPKTAGTSLTTVLKIQYKKHEIYQWDNIKFHEKESEFKSLPKNHIDKIQAKALKGHYHFGLHEYVQGTHQYVTFVRQPNKRLLSHLIQFLRMPNSHVAKDIKNGSTVADILNSYPFFRNAQVKWISGIPYNIQASDENRFEMAIENIEKYFLFVGLTERFDESLLVIKNLLNWKYPPFYTSLNVSKTHEKHQLVLSQKEQELINDLNFYDDKLYKFCEEKFNNYIACSNVNLTSFRKQLFLFQKAHRTYLSVKKFL